MASLLMETMSSQKALQIRFLGMELVIVTDLATPERRGTFLGRVSGVGPGFERRMVDVVRAEAPTPVDCY